MRTPGSRSDWAANIFLGDEVHAIAERRDDTNTGGAVEAGQAAPGKGAVEVADGHPVEFGEAAVDMPLQAFQVAPDVHVGRHLDARGRSDLHEADAAAIPGIDLEKALERS